MAKESKKSWQGRLKADADAATARLLASIDVDCRLWRYDIAGSIAHAEMLCKEGIINKAEFARIKKGLLDIAADFEKNAITPDVSLEDIHMVIEAELIRRIGPVGGKLHTGRSRNDQVALDLRLWARDAADNLIDAVRRVQKAFVSLAKKQGQLVMPAYTHLQRAQPIVAGHSLLAYVEMLERDAERLADARRRINVSPLGSGAVAGTSIPLNREFTAAALGFENITRNSIDATSDRDFLAELCFDVALMGVHLSRWAEDWIIYSSGEFALISLHDAYCTSSSMMPQKKNADTLELIRGKSAAGIAQLIGMLTLIKGLPLAYDRDMQDDKRFAFASVATMSDVLAVMPGLIESTTFCEKSITANIDKGFLDATSLAEYLVNKAVPFRTAHHIVGRAVAAADAVGKSLAELSLAELQNFSPVFGDDVRNSLT
ncbi:MAG TPA: argininosuccinate lyase, partial [Phycisphaerae bacterium]|nr:argininosuccinate lyase [Phycisphaerae bacterium]